LTNPAPLRIVPISMKTKELDFDSEELNLIKLAQDYADDDKARSLLESLRWPKGVVCPRCDNKDAKPFYKLEARPGSKAGARKGLYKCGACRKQFTVTVGTIFEDSHIPIGKWLMAYFILCSSKKSISAHQMHRMLGMTYKTAWFMCHRIRHAMASTYKTPKLGGIVESDETFVGGKCTMKENFRKKTPVVALIERGGKMRTAVVSNVTQKNLGKALAECVSKDAIVHTDELPAYDKPLAEWAGHHAVNHSHYEYTRTEPDGMKVHVNSCESFFALLKRGVHGSWHHVSREHLPRYASEFEFRWNHRKESDGERMKAAIAKSEGRRLTYRQIV
jgi:transposase-like protein